MSSLIDIVIYSGGIGGADVMSPSVAHQPKSLNNYLFTAKNGFFWAALGASLYRWPKKIIRDIIHVGLNTLSKV